VTRIGVETPFRKHSARLCASGSLSAETDRSRPGSGASSSTRARDERRAARRGPEYDADLQPRTNGTAPSEDARLAAAITLLPERQRLVVFLRYYADLDYESIAKALGIKGGTVAAALNAAHQTLRRSLQEVLQ
jgi:RNA polymerase sigma factor (sigma-70 family)